MLQPFEPRNGFQAPLPRWGFRPQLPLTSTPGVGPLRHVDDYDVIIIGAGLSGLAAGMRLAYFDRRVCILERHYAYGGMNSYYTIDGRKFDVGLHAVTNFAPRGAKSAPLTKLLRQLRIEWHELDLHPQHGSEIRFPARGVRFTNAVDVLEGEIAREFPSQVPGFRRLVSDIRSFDDTRLDAEYLSARAELTRFLTDPILIDMLLCPIMYYGSAEEHDMEFHQFVTMFKSIFLQGFARPAAGVRHILTLLVRKFRALGGRIRMQSGVDRLETKNGTIAAVRLDSGETLRAKKYLSCAGYPETMRLCNGSDGAAIGDVGRLSFVETIVVLDRPPHELGHDRTIVFFSERERFAYARPSDEVDLNSGIVCCPNNYDGLESEREFQLRLTWIANYERWKSLSPSAYRDRKNVLLNRALQELERHVPDVRRHTVATDMFTPRTIEHFTGRIQGAVYGSPQKHRDGCTPFSNLFVCGTDQGFLGIIGAMLSGITVANLHVLSEP